MRIIAGRARGLKLAEVGAGDPAAHLRPTSDKVRAAIFNILHSAMGDPVPGAQVLDLFAGTGALGLEALSRGAAGVTFVDDGAAALALVRANLAKLRAEALVLRRDATVLGAHRGAPHSLVFLDPPYGRGLGEAALQACAAGGWLSPGAVVVWEDGAPPPLPPGFALRDRRSYGQTVVTFLHAP